MITAEKRKEYQAKANKKRRERYQNDAEYRKVVLEYNRRHLPKDPDYRYNYTKQYFKNNPDKITQFRDNKKQLNDSTVEVSRHLGIWNSRWTQHEDLVCEVMYFSGASYESISKKLNRSIKSIDNRIQRIKKEMKSN